MVLILLPRAASTWGGCTTDLCPVLFTGILAIQAFAVGCAPRNADLNAIGGGDRAITQAKAKHYDELRDVALGAFQIFLDDRLGDDDPSYPSRPSSPRPKRYHVFFDEGAGDEHIRFVFSVLDCSGDGSYYVVIERASGQIIDVGVGM